jgi:hypothetical protein|tara:strand:+ start:147 stop:464 length:318 start_codon:yes stop_codon:yes gene_type:complete
VPLYKITYPDGRVDDGIICDDDVIPRQLAEGGGSFELKPEPEITSAQIERQARKWRNRQLSGTDKYVSVTDHPDHAKIMAYRVKLRQWPNDADADFPNTKPTIDS